MADGYEFLTETQHSVAWILKKNARRQVVFREKLDEAKRRFGAKAGKMLLNGASERAKQMVKERYFFDDLMMGKKPPKEFLRKKKRGERGVWEAYKPPLIDVLGNKVRNREKEYLDSCFNARGLTEEGRKAVTLPDEHWKEHRFYLHGNPDDGKTYFKHDITHHVTFQLPPGCNDVTKICFETFGTLFLNHSPNTPEGGGHQHGRYGAGAPIDMEHINEDSISEHYLSTDDDEQSVSAGVGTDYDFGEDKDGDGELDIISSDDSDDDDGEEDGGLESY